MLRIRQYEFGGPDVLRAEEVADLEPGPSQVRIAVEAAGVHLLDTSIRRGESPTGTQPQLPMTPGREVAGTVDALGAGVDPRWLGAVVVAHLGAGAGGGYAAQTVVDTARLHRVPDGLDPATAVAAIGTGRTAAGILRLVPIAADDVAIVTSAAGGLGVLLLQDARRVGARGIGLTTGPKLDVARRFGADLALDHRDPTWPSRLDVPATLVYDGVGGEVGRTAHGLLADGGRLVRFGWSSGIRNDHDDPRRPVVDVLGPRMTDVPGGIRALEAEALERAADGSRVPYVGSTFPLRAAAEAHRALEAGETTGKVVLVSAKMAR